MRKRGRVIVWLTGEARGRLAAMVLLIVLIVIVFTNQLPAAKTWTYWTLPLSGKVIVLDPGHGGPDGGARSAAGLEEKEVTLKIAMYLRDYLQQAGAEVVLTRETDTDLASRGTRGHSRRKTEDLKARASLVRETNPDLFLSIHLNAIPEPQWFGPQTFYTLRNDENPRLAWLIQDELRRNVTDTHRQSKRIRNIFVLDQSPVPTALVEVGFLSNAPEAARLADTEYQKRIAAAVYRGVLRFVDGEKPQEAPAAGEEEADPIPDQPVREPLPGEHWAPESPSPQGML